MAAILGAILFAIAAAMTFLAACGAPLGEFTMGGRYQVLPGRLRLAAAISFLIQLFAIVIILQMGGFLTLWFSLKITRNICIFFAVYLSINTMMNFLSGSKKEKFFMTPLSLLAAVCFWAAAFTR